MKYSPIYSIQKAVFHLISAAGTCSNATVSSHTAREVVISPVYTRAAAMDGSSMKLQNRQRSGKSGTRKGGKLYILRRKKEGKGRKERWRGGANERRKLKQEKNETVLS